MPVIGSFASMSKNGFSSPTTTGPINSYRWFDSLFYKSNVNATTTYGKKIGTEVRTFGRQGNASGTGYRSFITQLDVVTGLPSYYKIFSDTTNNYIIDFEKDTNNNQHLLFVNTSLIKYDNTDTLVLGYQYTGIGSTVNNRFGMVKDSNDYLYMLTISGTTYFVLTKIDPTNYNVIWSKKITMTVNDTRFYIDNADNIYVVAWTSTGTVNTVFQFNTSGSVVWQQSTSFSNHILYFSFDSSNNIYMLGNSNPGTLVKMDTSGAITYAYNVNTITAIGGNYTDIIINSDDNIVLYEVGTNNWATVILTPTAMVSYATSWNTGNPGITPTFNEQNMISVDGILYIVTTMQNQAGGTLPNVNLKVVNNNNIVYSTPFNFTVTQDNATTTNFSGTFTSTARTLPTKAVTSTTWAPTVYGTSSVTPGTTSVTRTLGATVPFSYSTPLI